MSKPLTSANQNSIGQHEHVTSQVLDPATGQPSSGATPTLAEVLVAGNDAAQTTITSVASLVGADDGLPVQLHAGGSTATPGARPGDATVGPPPGDGRGGAADITAGDGDTAAAGGIATIRGGYGDGGSSRPGEFIANGGIGDGSGGVAQIKGGQAESGTGGAGGDITLTPGAGDGAGRNGQIVVNGGIHAGNDVMYAELDLHDTGAASLYGQVDDDHWGQVQASQQDGAGVLILSASHLIIVQNLPTSDPGVSGALWNNGGTVKVSA